MTDQKDLARIRKMAEIVLEARSARLRKSSEQRAAVLSGLATLSKSHTETSTDLSGIKAAISFEAWASCRRSELNLRLAEAQARWLEDLEETRRAFGCFHVLRRLEEDNHIALRHIAEHRSELLPNSWTVFRMI